MDFQDAIEDLKTLLPGIEGDDFRWGAVSAILVKPFKANEVEGSSALQFTDSASTSASESKTEGFFPSLVVNDVFKTERLKLSVKLSSANLSSLSIEYGASSSAAVFEDDEVFVRRRPNLNAGGSSVGNPVIQVTGVRKLRDKLAVDDLIVFVRCSGTPTLYAFGIRKAVAAGKSIDVVAPRMAVAANDQFLKAEVVYDHSGATSEAASVGTNLIVYGPPGTGKSMMIKSRVTSAPVFRTQFHPEYSYADLLGSYRPVVGCEKSDADRIISHNYQMVARPVNYFAFVPGPLTEALECAFGSGVGGSRPDQVFLVIEEINRGDCAAIFGDIFQLLDRDDNGQSEYGISPKPELLVYFKEKGINFDIAGDQKLYLPPNLSLVATMNTSDQSLYPMDSAFKRRWQWMACPIRFTDLVEYAHARPFLDDGSYKWDWINLLERINDRIVRERMEDKQIGPWFIKPTSSGAISFDVFVNKFLFYLWHDVFKDEQLSDISPFSSDGPAAFSELQSRIREGGLLTVFKPEILADNNSSKV